MKAVRRCALPGALALAVLVSSGVALAATTYRDREGDVRGGEGPDITLVTLSHTVKKVKVGVRFASEPPLGVSEAEGWVDMLLVGIDVPPIGEKPVPNGAWLGANFVYGAHGPSKTGYLVRVGPNIPRDERVVARLPVATSGRTVTFTIPRRALGDPAWFRLMVGAGREAESGGGGGDFAPNRGTIRYSFTD